MGTESPDSAISEADADTRFGDMLRDGLAKARLGEGQRHSRLQTALELMGGERLVLIFDVWRPEASEKECCQIEALFNIVEGFEG